MSPVTNVKISSLSYLVVRVKDIRAAVPFYRDMLGLKVKAEHDDWVEFETGSCTLVLGANENPTLTSTYGGLPVFRVDDFMGTLEALRSAGVRIETGPWQSFAKGDMNSFFIEINDPDGNCLSIVGPGPT